MTRLDREAKTEGHQGVMAVAQDLDTVGLDDLIRAPKPFLLVCDGVIPRLPLETGNGKILHAERRGEQWRLGLA